jgi:hypothetical protein
MVMNSSWFPDCRSEREYAVPRWEFADQVASSDDIVPILVQPPNERPITIVARVTDSVQDVVDRYSS